MNGTTDTDVVVRSDAEVGEGPVWDARSHELIWVDIVRGVLHRSKVDGSDRAAGVGTMLGAAGLRGSGGYVAAVADGLGFIDGEGVLTLAENVLPDPAYRMNDGKCDRAGRFWAGSTTMTFVPGRGALHRWDPGAGVHLAVDGLTLPNGLGWSPDDRRFYLIDSVLRVLLVFDFDLADASLTNRRTLIGFSERDGLPDGLCVDLEGCIWVAFWGRAQVRRYSADGALLRTIELPVSQPASCAFGPGGVLYITSARSSLSEQQLAAQPLAGSVFAASVGVDGLDIGEFGG